MSNEPERPNVVREASAISAAERRQRLGHGAAVVWMTGLSASGKSTVAKKLVSKLTERSVVCCELDGDNMRFGLCRDLGFSLEDRVENIRRAAEVAKLMADTGLVAVVSFISPLAEGRARARATIEPIPFLECWVSTPLDVCESRDPKGLYAKARAGEIQDFTGIDSPYEQPAAPEVELPLHEVSAEEGAERIVQALVDRGVVGGG